MSLSVTVTGADKRVTLDFQAAATGWAKGIAPTAEAMMKARAPFRTGALRKGIGSELESQPALVSVTIYGTASYLPYVINGTQPHVIAARNARALRWFGPGGIGVNFATRVNNPGTKPNPFPQEAIEAITPMLMSRFKAAMQEALVIE